MKFSEFIIYYDLPVPQQMSEERREKIAENFFNRLDRTFMHSSMSQDEYDHQCEHFKEWEKLCDKFH